MFEKFIKSAISGTPEQMQEHAVNACKTTPLFSKERTRFIETLIQTGETLNEVREKTIKKLNAQENTIFDPQALAVKSAYCFQSAYVLSRTNTKKCSQNKRAVLEFQAVVQDLKRMKITPKVTPFINYALAQ